MFFILENKTLFKPFALLLVVACFMLIKHYAKCIAYVDILLLLLLYFKLSWSLFQWTPWDLISEKLCMVVTPERQKLFFFIFILFELWHEPHINVFF